MKHNNYFKIVTNALSHLEKEGDAINFDRSFALANLLPKKVDSFFTYNGSLSTPPCSEVVTWFVFPDSIPISFEQVSCKDFSLAVNSCISAKMMLSRFLKRLLNMFFYCVYLPDSKIPKTVNPR